MKTWTSNKITCIPPLDAIQHFLDNHTINTIPTFYTEEDIIKYNYPIKHTIKSYLDKNANRLIICCPLMVWNRIHDTFIMDTKTYKIQHHTNEEIILCNLVNWYKNLNTGVPTLSRNKWCIPGYARIIFKNKDTILLSTIL
jgi:hypothetical protein